MSEYEAGPELDALIAERVMGWPVNRRDGGHWHTIGTGPRYLVGRDCCADKYDDGAFCPSTKIASAWQAVETLSVDYLVHVQSEDGKFCCVVFCDNGQSVYDEIAREYAVTAPLAICRAALKVAEVPA